MLFLPSIPSDPSLMLVNPHEDLSLFDFEDFEEEEVPLPLLMLTMMINTWCPSASGPFR